MKSIYGIQIMANEALDKAISDKEGENISIIIRNVL